MSMLRKHPTTREKLGRDSRLSATLLGITHSFHATLRNLDEVNAGSASLSLLWGLQGRKSRFDLRCAQCIIGHG